MGIPYLNQLTEILKDIVEKYGVSQLEDEQYIVSQISYNLTNAEGLLRSVRMLYDSNAVADIFSIISDRKNEKLHRNHAIDRLTNYSFMDKQIAAEIIDAMISVLPNVNKTYSEWEKWEDDENGTSENYDYSDTPFSVQKKDDFFEYTPSVDHSINTPRVDGTDIQVLPYIRMVHMGQLQTYIPGSFIQFFTLFGVNMCQVKVCLEYQGRQYVVCANMMNYEIYVVLNNQLIPEQNVSTRTYLLAFAAFKHLL